MLNNESDTLVTQHNQTDFMIASLSNDDKSTDDKSRQVNRWQVIKR
jgi:hypothetical protein